MRKYFEKQTKGIRNQNYQDKVSWRSSNMIYVYITHSYIILIG